jgi:MFS family permease
VALLSAVFSLAQFLAAPLLGSLSDRFGRKRIFMLCMGVTAVSYLGLAIADTLWLIFAARILSGIGAGKIGIAQAIVADSTTPETRARGMGMIGAAFGLGMILGPILGGLLIGNDPEHPNFHAPALAATFASVAAVSLAAYLLRETHRPGSAAARRMSRNPLGGLGMISPTALALVLTQFAIFFVFAQLETLFPLFAADRLAWGPYQVGLSFTFIGVIIMAVQGVLIGPMTRRFGEAVLLRGGILALAIGMGMSFLIHDWIAFAISMALTAFGFATINPSANSLVSRAADPEYQGLTLGVSQSMGALGRVLGPILGGFLFEQVSIDTPYIGGTLTLLVALALAWKAIRAAGERHR